MEIVYWIWADHINVLLVAMTNNQCKYNGNSVFVFSDNDESISIGKKFVDLGYGGIALSFTCLSVIVAIRCKKSIFWDKRSTMFKILEIGSIEPFFNLKFR